MEQERRGYLVEVQYPGITSGIQTLSEQFYVFADSAMEAVTFAEIKSGGAHGKVVHSLSPEEVKRFRFLESARL